MKIPAESERTTAAVEATVEIKQTVTQKGTFIVKHFPMKIIHHSQ